jgi:hypothetical protein
MPHNAYGARFIGAYDGCWMFFAFCHRCGYVIVNLKSRVQDREAAFAQIMRDYFVDCSLYSEEDFWRRYATLHCCPFQCVKSL